jgi:hypothetical protein
VLQPSSKGVSPSSPDGEAYSYRADTSFDRLFEGIVDKVRLSRLVDGDITGAESITADDMSTGTAGGCWTGSRPPRRVC